MVETVNLIEAFGYARDQGKGGIIYRVDDADIANGKIGNCWMKGRLHKGDLVLETHQTGQNFYNYVLIRQIANGFEFCEGSRFGAYGTPGTEVSKINKEQGVALLKDGFLPFAKEKSLEVEYHGPRIPTVV